MKLCRRLGYDRYNRAQLDAVERTQNVGTAARRAGVTVGLAAVSLDPVPRENSRFPAVQHDVSHVAVACAATSRFLSAH